MSQRNFLTIVLAIIVSYACHMRADRVRHARYLGQAIEVIQQGALAPTTRQELFEGAMKGMVEVLDEKGDHHSAFLSSRDVQRFMAELDQQIVGVGIRLSLEAPEGEDEKQLTVVEVPLANTPAFKAGIRKGDRIVAINGKSIAGFDMPKIVERIRGKEGEAVDLTLERDSLPEPLQVRVVRKTIELPSVIGDLCDSNGEWDYHLPGDDRIGYVRITSFGAKTVSELKQVLKSLAEKDLEGLILDVRDNPGGELNAVVDVCSLFLPEGELIVSTHGRGDVLLEVFASPADGPYTDFPIVVLTNQFSASASEILAACLQDTGRAVVIGERTYGKGTVQQLLAIEGGRSRLKLTAHKYHRPSGKNIHRADEETPEDQIWGVVPDDGFQIKQSDEEETAWRKARRDRDEADWVNQHDGKEVPELVDVPLNRAVEQLRSQLN